MATDPGHDGAVRTRASHADREQVVSALKAAFVQGRLATDELDARVGAALAARTQAELAVLTEDIPVVVQPGGRARLVLGVSQVRA